MVLTPSPAEQERLADVLASVRTAIVSNTTIRLPEFDANNPAPGETALHLVGIEQNDFSGQIGDFRYQFEGEEDLLHLFVVRLDGKSLAPEDGQSVAAHVLDGVPPGLVWFKPGQYTQHFYFGHELLP